MIFGELESFFAFLDRAKRWFQPTISNDDNDVIDSTSLEVSVATRFIRLFDSHGVHRNQIPGFLGYDLTIANVKDDETLLPYLTEELLDAACEKFAVRREWLDGVELQVHPCHDFYKHPDQFINFLEHLKSSNKSGYISGTVLKSTTTFNDQALVILQEEIGYIGSKQIFRYHLCNNWFYHYWKSRAYLTACIAIATKNHNYLHGITTTHEIIEKLAYGESLLGYADNSKWTFANKTWYPDDLPISPEKYLEDIRPEEHNYGLVSALKLWLELEQKGYMETYIIDIKKIRDKFINELKKYN